MNSRLLIVTVLFITSLSASSFDIRPTLSVPNTHTAPIGYNVEIWIKLQGWGTVANIPVVMEYNGMVYRDTVSYFPSQFGFPFSDSITVLPGDNLLVIYHELTDMDSSNDTLYTNLKGLPVIDLTYFGWKDDFESIDNWGGDVTNAWDLGPPNGQVINSAHSGSNVWMPKNVVNPNQDKKLFSPYFVYSGTSNPLLSFYHWTNMPINHPMIYGRLYYGYFQTGAWYPYGGSGTGPGIVNWYNHQLGNGQHVFQSQSNGWQYSSIPIFASAYLSNYYLLQFAFDYSNYPVNPEIWAIDDFEIYVDSLNYDLQILSLDMPNSDTIAGTMIYPEITIRNGGLHTLDSIAFHLMVENQTFQDTFFSSLAFDSVAHFTFSSPFMVPPDSFVIQVIGSLNGDMIPGNNQISKKYYSTPVAYDLAMGDFNFTNLTNPNLNPFGGVLVDGHDYKMIYEIKNLGTSAVAAVPFELLIDSSSVLSDICNQSIPPSATITDSVTLHLQAPTGNRVVCAQTNFTNDAYPYNNSYCLSLINIQSSTEVYEQIKFSIELNLFPNPAKEMVSLKYSLPYRGASRIQIRNMIGQIIDTIELKASDSSNQLEIDVSSLTNGVYSFSLEFEGNSISEKLVVVK